VEVLTLQFWSVLGAVFAPLYIVAIVYTFIRYKNYPKKEVVSVLIATGILIGSYIVLHPKQRIFFGVFDLLMIPLGLLIWGMVALKNRLNR